MEFTNVVKTNIQIPQHRRGILTRQRLIDKILVDITSRRLVALVAPAGYGKTVLLIDVARQAELPVCWYTIDKPDNNLHRFSSHLVEAIHHKFVTFGENSSAFIDNNILTDRNVSQLATIMINELHDTIKEDFILILDDFHLVSDQKSIRQLLGYIIQASSGKYHFAIASRKTLQLPDMIKMAVANQVTGLGIDDVAFTPTEVKSLFLKKQTHISNLEAERKVMATEGWITGILLNADSRKSNLDKYFTEQVLEPESAPIQEFLLQSALLGEFDVTLCRHVFGPGPWAKVIEQIANDNVFVIEVGDSIRYHHLFEDFLRIIMRDHFYAEMQDILRRLAALQENWGQWEEAYGVLGRLGDKHAMANFVERVGSSLVDAGRFELLEQWLDAGLVEGGELLRLKGVVKAMRGNPMAGLVYLEQAVELFQDGAGFLKALVDRAMTRRFLGDYEGALQDAETVLAVDKIDPGALREKAMMLYQLGQLREAISWGQDALLAYEAVERERDSAIMLSELGLYFFGIGKYDQAIQYSLEAEGYWQKSYNFSWLATTKNNLGLSYLYKGEYEQSLAAIEIAIDYGRKSGFNRLTVYTLTSLGDLLSLFDIKAAQKVFTLTQELATEIDEHFALFYAIYTQAKLARLSHDVVTCETLLKKASELANESVYELGLCKLEQAELALSLKSSSAAIDLAQEAIGYFGNDRPVEKLNATMTLAQAYYQQKNGEMALAELNQVFTIASEIDSDYPLIVISLNAHDILGEFKESAVGYQIQCLLRNIHQFKQNLPRRRRLLRQQQQHPIILMTPPKLIIKTLAQHTSILLAGEILAKPIWTNNRTPREVFFYLLSCPDGAARSNLAYTFWPDHQEAQIRNVLSKALFKIRGAFADKTIILLDKATHKYYFNRDIDYECDAEIFEAKVEAAKLTEVRAEKITLYKAAINLYQRSYLPEIDREWAWFERERLENLYVEANLQVSKLYLDIAESQNALKYCNLALVTNPTLEAAHRLAMCIYAAQGNQAAVIHQFKRCQQIMQREVDAPVSNQTLALYKSLLL